MRKEEVERQVCRRGGRSGDIQPSGSLASFAKRYNDDDDDDDVDQRRRSQTRATDDELCSASGRFSLATGLLDCKVVKHGDVIESERPDVSPSPPLPQGRAVESAGCWQEFGADSTRRRRRITQESRRRSGELLLRASRADESAAATRRRLASCRATSNTRRARCARGDIERGDAAAAAAARRVRAAAAAAGIEVGGATREVKLDENENEIEIDDRRQRQSERKQQLTTTTTSSHHQRHERTQQSQSSKPAEVACDSLGRPARDASATFSLSFYDHRHQLEVHEKSRHKTSRRRRSCEDVGRKCTIASGVELTCAIVSGVRGEYPPAPPLSEPKAMTTTAAVHEQPTITTTTTKTANNNNNSDKTTMSQLDDHHHHHHHHHHSLRVASTKSAQFEIELENHKNNAESPALLLQLPCTQANKQQQQQQQQQLNIQSGQNQPQAQQLQQQQQLAIQQQPQQQPLQRQYPPNHPLGNSKHLCSICGDRATGKHYGVYSCEGCKGFFKRTIRKDIVYVCRSQGSCLIDMRQRNRCQYCRYQKCLTRGMKREAVQEEKQRLKLRAAGQQVSAIPTQHTHHNTNYHNNSSHHQQTQLIDLNNNQQTFRQQQQQSNNNNQCDTSDNQFSRVESTTAPSSGAGHSTGGIMFGDHYSYQEQQQHYNHHHHHQHQQAPHDNQQVLNGNYHHHHHHHSHHASHEPATPTATAAAAAATPTPTPLDHWGAPFSPSVRKNSFAGGSPHSLASSSGTGTGSHLRRPNERIDELTLKWAAQVQIERLLDWAKSVPKFTELLLDDQVTLLRSHWNELIIADIAYRSAECLRSDGHSPLRKSSSTLSSRQQQQQQHSDSLCIGRGLFIREHQAHEIGLGTMYERILNELVTRMYDMRLDANELACLRAIVLFNPETHGLKTSQPIEEYRGNIYTTLETYCKRHYENQPNRFGKLLLRLPVLRSIGLKCDSAARRCESAAANQLVSTTTTTTTNTNSSTNDNNCQLFGAAPDTSSAGSPASSGASSVNSNCSNSISSTSAGLVSTTNSNQQQQQQPLGSPHKFTLQVKLLFFDLCYESSAVDQFLRSSLSLHH